jgi:hypothetical protein
MEHKIQISCDITSIKISAAIECWFDGRGFQLNINDEIQNGIQEDSVAAAGPCDVYNQITNSGDDIGNVTVAGPYRFNFKDSANEEFFLGYILFTSGWQKNYLLKNRKYEVSAGQPYGNELCINSTDFIAPGDFGLLE